MRQTYSVTRLTYRKGKLIRSRKIGGGPTAPNNAGKKTIPNYNGIANQAIRGLKGGGKVFTGQRDDPFFIDLTVPFDALNFRLATGNQGGGDDVVRLQRPRGRPPGAGGPGHSQPQVGGGAGHPNAVVGVWSPPSAAGCS